MAASSFNRRHKSGKLYWLGTGSAPLAETNTADTSTTQYIFFNGKRIARLDPGATTPKYYVADNVGSTELVTDYLGNPLSESEFYPYGVEMQVLTGDPNTYKFTGKERDAESGNDYFGARYYSSALGRFLSPDWDAKPTTVPYASFGDPQTLNLYAYVENEPLNKVDADGHVAQANIPFPGVDPEDLGMTEGNSCGLSIACYMAAAVERSGTEFSMLQAIAYSDYTAGLAAVTAAQATANAQKQGKSHPKAKSKPKLPPYVVAAEDNPPGTVVNGTRGRDVDYGVFEVNSDGSLGYQTHKFTITLNEKLGAGSHAGTGICDHPNCSEEGAFEDRQSVKEGTPYSVERRWSVNGPNGSVPVPVWNPSARAPAGYEVLHLDFKSGFTMEYKDQ